MKNIGYLLIAAGFMAGAYLTSLHATEVSWVPFVIFLVIGFVGVVLVQTGTKQEAQSTDKISSNISVIEQSLANLVRKTEQLNQDKGSIHTYDMRHKLDEVLIDDLNNFVESRESIGHKYGLQAYAEVMNHFAAGERYLNRVWSASADGYIDEVNSYIEKAAEQFRNAEQQLATTRQTMG